MPVNNVTISHSTPNQTATPAAPPANVPVAPQPVQPTQPVQVHPAPLVTPAARPAPPVPAPRSNQPAIHQPAAVQHSATLPPPHVLVRQQNQDGALDDMLSKEEYKSSANHGKLNYNELGMAKPYMFIYREGLQTPRQKLDVRATMSMLEYINGTLLLLQDADAFRQEDLPHILVHLTAVSTDAMVRPWGAVRAWSQYIWDCIEKGKCTWTSFQFIQNERVRMSFISGTPSGSSAGTSISHKPVSHEMRTVLCREYNSVSGCRHNGTHDDQSVKYLHACCHCDSMGRRSAHSYQRCRSKMDAGNHNNDNRQWYQGNQRHQHGHHSPDGHSGNRVAYGNGTNSQGHGGSKNV